MQEAWDGEDALKERILGGNSREEKGVCRVEVWTRVFEKMGGKVDPGRRRRCLGRGR